MRPQIDREDFLRRVDRRRSDDALPALRAALGDANLVGIYTRDGVRLDAAGNVACVDDARCSTSTGRLLVPRVNGSYVNLGNQPSLNGLVKFSAVVRFTFQTLIGSNQQHLFGRFTSGVSSADTTNFSLRISGSGNLFLQLWDTTGAAVVTPTLVSPLVAGTDYYLSVVFDGTLASGARVRLGIAPVTNGVAGAFTFSSAGGPTEIATTTTPLTIGSASDGTSPVAGPIDTIAVYIGTALTDGQISTEIVSGFAGANHRWTFDGTLADSGTTGGWGGGMIGTGLAYCSDDTRWGGILMGGGGSANPTWDAVNREVVFDGVSQYLKAVGGTLTSITDSQGVAWVGQFPAITAAEQRLWEIGDSATGAGNSLLMLYEAATSGTIGVNAATVGVGTASSATSYPGARVVHGRRTNNGGGTVVGGVQIGGANESSGAPVTAAPTTAQQFTIATSRGLSQYAAGRWRSSLLYAGDYAGKQSFVNTFAQRLGATL